MFCFVERAFDGGAFFCGAIDVIPKFIVVEGAGCWRFMNFIHTFYVFQFFSAKYGPTLTFAFRGSFRIGF